MRTKIREVLNDCILEGLHSGYQRAYKYEDFPCEENLISHMEDHIWFEIDRRFVFDNEPDEDHYPRGVCTEVVEGFDHLEKKREWVGLTGADYEINKFYTNEFLDGVEWAEAKLKEKNT